MRFLPIAERELRVMSHQARTWWQRVLILAGALAVFSFAYLSFRRWNSPSQLGLELFSILGGFGFVYALLTGPLVTVDCISRERRDGTLGLLFLTNLRSYDVVLGKLGAASFGMVLGLTAALPVAAIPMLMGGVSLEQFTYVALALLNAMFLSLALGVCASALVQNGRVSLGLTVATLLFLTLGFPLLGEEVFHIGMNSTTAPWFYAVCPLYTMERCLGRLGSPNWHYWVNMGGIHLLGWCCLSAACFRTATSWREETASAPWRIWAARLDKLKQGSMRRRRWWRNVMLERNPIAWLEGRDRLQTKLLWGIIMLAAAVLFITHTVDPEEYPSKDVVDAWPFIAHYVLCLWIAIRAPRRLADDKQSGALELLLCTPLTAREIVRGNMLFLRRRFGGVLVTLMALDALLIFTYFEARDGWIGFREDEWSSLSAGALLVFPLQAWSIARVGVYQGLLRANSLRATFIAIWLLGLLPIVLWVVFMVTCDLLNLARNMNDTLISWALATLHVIPCTLFLSYASWRLHFRFRFLAAQAAPGVWWKRWLEEYRRPKGLSIQKGAIRN